MITSFDTKIPLLEIYLKETIRNMPKTLLWVDLLTSSSTYNGKNQKQI